MKRTVTFLFMIQIFILSTIFIATQSSATVYALPWSDLSQNSTINARATPNFIYGNEPLAICTETLAQSQPDICSDGLGGAIITWYDYRNGNYDIYAQRIDVDGNIKWTAGGVAICTESGSQINQEILSDGRGGAFIVWQDQRSGNYDIYAQRVNSTGHALWTINGTPICTVGSSQNNPKLCSDGVGGIIIAWVHDSNSIYAQRINAIGNRLWVINGELVSDEATCNWFYAICSDGDQGAILAWEDFRVVAGLYAQRINSTGDYCWGSSDVAICTLGTSYDPQIFSDGTKGAIIAWEDHEDATIRVQRVDSGGNRLWDANGTEICNEAANRGCVQICGDGLSGVMLVWDDYRSGNRDIYAQRVNENGATYWTANGIVICNAAGEQSYQKICYDGFGGAFITWHDNRFNYDIYAQRIDLQGNIMWDVNGIAICTAQNAQYYPNLCVDGVGGVIIVWEDRRISMAQADIYAQHVSDYLIPPQQEPELYKFIPILLNAPAGLGDLLELLMTPIGMGVAGGLVLTIVILAVIVSRKNK